jgi:PAS domain S-box-containing protein
MNDKQERVLVVDDDVSILFLMTRSLERHGYEVEGAADGLEGMEIIKNSPPFSVLLTDLMMPGLDGLELIQFARDRDPYIEIIVITAAASIESAISAMRDGKAYDYLLKPLDSMSQLPVIIDRAVAHRRLVIESTVIQKKMESEAQRLLLLIESVGDAILAASSDGIITIANPAALHQFAQEELVGKDVHSVLPAKLVNIVENWQAIAGNAPASMEIHLQNNSVHMLSLTPILEEADNRWGWAMILRDITPLKRSDQLKTQALQEAIGKIRVPLAEAMGAVVDLNMQLPQDERVAASVFQLTSVWERIQTWSDELLDVMQGEAEWHAQPKKINLQKILDTIQADQAVRLFRQGGGRLSINPVLPLPLVRTDPDMLNRLLSSLVKRAVMRSDQDGEIRIQARAFKGQVWIEISDTGSPVSAPNIMQIFDKSVSELATGSLKVGLELVRAKSILDRLDGQLWVAGSGPRGGTIIVCLPAISETPS